MTKVLLIDNQPLTARGIKKLLTDRSFIVIEGGNQRYSYISDIIEQQAPQLIIVDPLNADHQETLQLQLLKKAYQSIPIVALTNAKYRDEVLSLLSAGVLSHISKEASETDLLAGVDASLKGQSFFCKYTRSLLFENKPNENVCLPAFTDREKEIIQLIADGNSDKEIAEVLFLSYHTIRTHRKNISKKAGFSLKNAAELMLLVRSLSN